MELFFKKFPLLSKPATITFQKNFGIFSCSFMEFLESVYCSDVVWLHGDIRLPHPERLTTEYSQRFITALDDVTANQSGDYHCSAVSKDGKTSYNYSLHIKVCPALYCCGSLL